MRVWIGWLIAFATALSSAPSVAHVTPNSEINLDFGTSEVRADVIIPLGDYAAASGNAVDGSRASLDGAAEFIRGKVRASGPSGRAWKITIERVEFVRIAGPPDLHAILTLTPPSRDSARRFVLTWRAVVDTVPGHFVLIVARSDFAAGAVSEQRQILGAFRGDRLDLTIDRGTASHLAGFLAAVSLGLHHIAEGYDHLLFLVALLIPAPLAARNGRWNKTVPPKRAAWRLATIVTAFTVGHSITLLGGVLLGWRMPERLVEFAIAASILISAVHAWRPIFPGREAWIAAGFGLVHGLAFATLANGFGLGLTERVLATLGFNLGVELFQLVVVAAVMPFLFLLAPKPFYTFVRATLASFAGLAALAWMVERITGQSNQVAALADIVLAHSPWLIALASFAAVIVSFRKRLASGAKREAG